MGIQVLIGRTDHWLWTEDRNFGYAEISMMRHVGERKHNICMNISVHNIDFLRHAYSVWK